MVHVEEVYTAFLTFAAAQANAMQQFSREPKKYREAVKKAQENLMDFCTTHNLPIDFSPPHQEES